MNNKTPYRKHSEFSRGELALLILGVGLLLLSTTLVVAFPEAYERSLAHFRIMGALGAALIGAWLPGAFNLSGPGYKVSGAIAIIALFYLVDPPREVNTGVNRESPDKPALLIPGQPPEDATPTAPLVAQVTPPAPTPTLACAFVPIRGLGWRSGHKTNYCKNYGYEQGNFNQGDYQNGGICMSGPEPDVCRDFVTNRLDSSKYACTTDSAVQPPRTTCLIRP